MKIIIIIFREIFNPRIYLKHNKNYRRPINKTQRMCALT